MAAPSDKSPSGVSEAKTASVGPASLSTTARASVISPLDRAHASWLKKDREGALRLVVGLLDADGNDLGAVALGCRALIDEGRGDCAVEVARRLVDAYCRRGDLPQATAAAKLLDAAGEDSEPETEKIGTVFGKGSARVAQVSPAPPPLPKESKKAAVTATGDALLDLVEERLRKFLASDDPVAADSKVPELPLFGSLEPADLAAFLDCLNVDEFPAGVAPVRQGEEGREAFVVIRGVLSVVRRSGADESTLATLGPGAIFGEMALLSDAPRAASVVATESTQLLSIHRDDLERFASGNSAIASELGAFCRTRMVANLFRTCAALRSLPDAARPAFVQSLITRTFDGGESLIEEGAEPDRLMFLASGAVRVFGVDGDGERIQLATLGPGDVVGEVSFILRRQTIATVVADHPTVALELNEEHFRKMIRAFPTFLVDLYELATEREKRTRAAVSDETFNADDVVLL